MRTELLSTRDVPDDLDVPSPGDGGPRDDRGRTEFARLDPGIMGLPIFRALPKRGRDKARKRMFEVDTVHDGRRLRVVGAYTLGPDDLSVLLAVLALSGLDGKTILAKDSKSARVAILDGLESEGEVVEAVHMRVRTSLHAVCREAGIPANKEAYDRVSESLRRIRAVHYDDLGPVGANFRRLYASGKQNLLSAKTRDDTKELEVVINARFAQFILGDQWGTIDLRESRRLGEMARLLHQRLSVMVRQGGSLRVRVDRLVEWAYGDEKAPAATTRNRRREVRDGLKGVARLPGWTVEGGPTDPIVTVSRAARERPEGDAGAAPRPPPAPAVEKPRARGRLTDRTR